jgi:hypothetical protein
MGIIDRLREVFVDPETPVQPSDELVPDVALEDDQPGPDQGDADGQAEAHRG